MLKLSRMHMNEMGTIEVCDTFYTISCHKKHAFVIQDNKAVIFYSIKGCIWTHAGAFFFYHCVGPFCQITIIENTFVSWFFQVYPATYQHNASHVLKWHFHLSCTSVFRFYISHWQQDNSTIVAFLDTVVHQWCLGKGCNK